MTIGDVDVDEYFFVNLSLGKIFLSNFYVKGPFAFLIERFYRTFIVLKSKVEWLAVSGTFL